MVPCTECGEEITGEYAACTSQKACKLHFGGCSGIQEASWKKTDKTGWKCPQCRKGKTSDAPVSAEEMRKFMRSVNEFMASVKEKLEVMDELKESVRFMSEQYDEVMNKMKKAEEEREEQRTCIANLVEKVDKREADIKQLQRRIRETEQYARNRNIEVTGVEVVDGQDLKKVMKNIAAKINVPFQESDIDIIHRLPSKRGDGPPKIVAQFSNRTTRNRWLRQKNHDGAMVSKEVVQGGTGNTRVYLNTHLTPEWQRLLWMSKQAGRPKGYKLIWFHDHRIIAKKDFTDTKPVFIYGEEDIDRMH